MSEDASRNRRREFLKLLGAAPAAAAAALPAAASEPEARDPSAPAEYRETDHVRTFYRLARF